MELRDAYIGSDKVARIYTGDEVVYPSPVRDGLVLWYDFMGRKNSDAQRAVAEDLSGNGNHGSVHNMAYTNNSEYSGGGIVFDGVDDRILIEPLKVTLPAIYSIELVMKINSLEDLLHTSIFIGNGAWITGAISDVSGVAIGYSRTFAAGIRIVDRSSWTVGPGIPPDDIPIGVPFLLTFAGSSSGGTVYLNGILENVQTYGRGNKVVSSLGIARGVDYGSPAKFTNFATRIYNRALTTAEIQHNYQLEKERWNL